MKHLFKIALLASCLLCFAACDDDESRNPEIEVTPASVDFDEVVVGFTGNLGLYVRNKGYGDLVLPLPWRMLGPVEGLTGILMCGLSTGFFFAFLSRVFGAKFKDEPG